MTGTRRSARLARNRDDDGPTDGATANYIPSDDSESDYEPKSPSLNSSKRQQRGDQPTKKGGRSKKRVKFNHLGNFGSSLQDLGLPPLDPQLDKNTSPLVHDFYDRVLNHGLKVKPGVLRPYTPNLHHAEHILTMPLHDPANRQYQLIEDEVQLVPHTQPDGSQVQAWIVRAQNIKAADQAPVDLFLLHAMRSTYEGFRCRPCQRKYRQATKVEGKKKRDEIKERFCDQAMPVCGRCRSDNENPDDCWFEQKHRFNMLTEHVLDDRDRVIQLARLKVDIMNRAPFDLNLAAWEIVDRPTPTIGAKVVAEKAWIDTVSFAEFKRRHMAEFDFDLLKTPGGQSPWTGQINHSMGVGGAATFGNHASSIVVYNFKGKGVWVTDSDNGATLGTRRGWEPGEFSPASINVSTVAAESECMFPFLFGRDPDDLRNKQLDQDFVNPWPSINLNDASACALIKAVQKVAERMVGFVGTGEGLKLHFAQQMNQYYEEGRGNMKYRRHQGPYDGANLWLINYGNASNSAVSATGWEMVLSAEAQADLDPGSYKSMKSYILRTRIGDRACIAFIAQESLHEYGRSQNLLRAMLAACEAADAVRSGLLSKSTILENYCTCPDPDTQAITEHYCTNCFIIRPCIVMREAQSEEDPLLRCSECVGQNYAIPTKGSQMMDKIRFKCRVLAKADGKFYTPQWTAADLQEVLVGSSLAGLDNPRQWKDAYSGQVRSLDELKGTKSMKGHPLSPSLEKPYARWLRNDGDISLHDPGNAVMTTDAINRSKGILPPAALPLMKQSMRLKTAAIGSKPCTGYAKNVQERWAIWERATDNLHVITAFSGRSKPATRVRPNQNRSVIRRHIEMERTGVWDGKTRTKLPSLFNRGSLKNKSLKDDSGNPQFSMNDDHWNWETIMNNIEYMEKDTGPDGFNKHKLKLPRLGLGRIPWLWREDHCPDDLDEQYIFDEFSNRLSVMAESCNRHHDTEESPATLFLEAVVQWFETGGKCHLFGMIMTPFKGHFSCYSIGRGVLQLTDDGARDIPPGSRMATGCTKRLPTNMRSDYDIKRRTVVFESWRANALRYDYEGGTALIKSLESLILSLSDQTEWYDALKTDLNAYPKVPIPKSYRNRGAWIKAMEVGPKSVGEDDIDDEDAVEDDEEVAFYQEQQAEISRIVAGTDDDGEDEAAAPSEGRDDLVQGMEIVASDESDTAPEEFQLPESLDEVDQMKDLVDSFVKRNGGSMDEPTKRAMLSLAQFGQEGMHEKLKAREDRKKDGAFR